MLIQISPPQGRPGCLRPELDIIAAQAESIVQGVAKHEPVDAAIGWELVSAACRAASMFVPKLTTNSKQIATAVFSSSAARCPVLGIVLSLPLSALETAGLHDDGPIEARESGHVPYSSWRRTQYCGSPAGSSRPLGTRSRNW